MRFCRVPLTLQAKLAGPLVDVGEFGIVDCDSAEAKDSALLLEWTALPHTLQKDTVINSMGEDPIVAKQPNEAAPLAQNTSQSQRCPISFLH
jgi:hypothetical protein